MCKRIWLSGKWSERSDGCVDFGGWSKWNRSCSIPRRMASVCVGPWSDQSFPLQLRGQTYQVIAIIYRISFNLASTSQEKDLLQKAWVIFNFHILFSGAILKANSLWDSSFISDLEYILKFSGSFIHIPPLPINNFKLPHTTLWIMTK